MNAKRIICCVLLVLILLNGFSAPAAAAPARENSWQYSFSEPVWIDACSWTRHCGRTRSVFEGSYPVFTVGENAGGELQSALDTWSQDLKKEAEEFLDEQEQIMWEQFREPGISDRNFVCTHECSIVRSDPDIVSIFQRGYLLSTPAAHGVDFYSVKNLDPSTGKELSISDIVRKTDALPEILTDVCEKQYGPDAFVADVAEAAADLIKNDALPAAVTMEGVTFIFPPTSIRTYIDGATMVTLLYEDYPDLFAKKLYPAGDCIERLIPNFPYSIKVDGEARRFTFWDYGNNEGLRYWVDEKTAYAFGDSWDSETADSLFLIRTGGQYMLYRRDFFSMAPEDPIDCFCAYTMDSSDMLQEVPVDPEIAGVLMEKLTQDIPSDDSQGE